MKRSDVIVRLAVARHFLAEAQAPGVVGGYSQAIVHAADPPPIEQWMVEAGHLQPLQAARLRDDFLITNLQCSCGWMGVGRDTGGDRDGGCPQCQKSSDYWPMIPETIGDDSAGTLPSDRMPMTAEHKRAVPQPPAGATRKQSSRRQAPPQPQPSARPQSGVRAASSDDNRLISGDVVEVPYDPANIPSSTVVGDWRVQERVGTGATGVVYRAADVTLDRPVAIKVLSEDLLQNQSLVTRFRNEAKTLARLDHPNVLHVYRLGQVGRRPYIVMQWVDGGSLAKWMKINGQPDPEQAAKWLSQAAAGLAAAHAQGIIHRDVKPDNLMLTRDGVLKVADFGLAKEVDSDIRISQTGAFLGTPAYVAPEQIDGSRDLTPQADVYSLGITAFELLTGKLPFKAKTLVQLLYAHTSEVLPSMREFARHVPPNLDALVQRMCAKQPENRPPMELVAQAFAKLAAGVIERDESLGRILTADRYQSPDDDDDHRESVTEEMVTTARPHEPAPQKKKSADYYQLPLDDDSGLITTGRKGLTKGPLTPSGRSSSASASSSSASSSSDGLTGRSGKPPQGMHPAKTKRSRGCVGTAVTVAVWLFVILLTAAFAFAIWWLATYRRLPTADDFNQLQQMIENWTQPSPSTGPGESGGAGDDAAGGAGVPGESGTDLGTGDDPLSTLVRRVRDAELRDARRETGQPGVLVPDWMHTDLADSTESRRALLTALHAMISRGTKADATRARVIFLVLVNGDGAGAQDTLHNVPDDTVTPEIRAGWGRDVRKALTRAEGE